MHVGLLLKGARILSFIQSESLLISFKKIMHKGKGEVALRGSIIVLISFGSDWIFPPANFGVIFPCSMFQYHV